jgi:hypothetical protein
MRSGVTNAEATALLPGTSVSIALQEGVDVHHYFLDFAPWFLSA